MKKILYKLYAKVRWNLYLMSRSVVDSFIAVSLLLIGLFLFVVMMAAIFEFQEFADRTTALKIILSSAVYGSGFVLFANFFWHLVKSR